MLPQRSPPTLPGIMKPDIRRLLRRGGVKRTSGIMYQETRGALKFFFRSSYVMRWLTRTTDRRGEGSNQTIIGV
ncbi:hypothetical protein B0H14DRAFT_2756549, partial [Mycena olivaceomarginata]